MNNKAYYNSSGKKVLEYISDDTVTLDLPFILTKGKQLTVNMPYMKLEKFLADTHVAAVRILGVEDKYGVVHLNVQELESGVTYTLSYNLEFNAEWWLWSLADMDSLLSI